MAISLALNQLKGEFKNTSSSESLIIALRIPTRLGVNSKKNNPKSIDVQTDTYFLPAFNLPVENWNDYKVQPNDAIKQRNDFFGIQNINFFTMLHYIRQEDRLSYFKKPEADRTTSIEHLFGIENDILKANEIDQAQKLLNQKLKALVNEMEQLTSDVESLPRNIDNNIEYFSLAGGKP